jgi:hypothetical protein
VKANDRFELSIFYADVPPHPFSTPDHGQYPESIEGFSLKIGDALDNILVGPNQLNVINDDRPGGSADRFTISLVTRDNLIIVVDLADPLKTVLSSTALPSLPTLAQFPVRDFWMYQSSTAVGLIAGSVDVPEPQLAGLLTAAAMLFLRCRRRA